MSDGAPTDARSGWRVRQLLPSSRRVTQWTFAAMRVALLLSCLFLITWVINYNPVSWDLSEEQLFSISDQTRAVLGSLEQPVTLTAFVEGGESRNPGIDRVLTAYSEASRLVRHRLVDPQAEPALASEFHVREYGTLVVQGADRVQRADAIEEPAITNAILTVDHGVALPVCVLTGHGERDPADKGRTGLSAAATGLGQTNYEVRVLNLTAAVDVPGDCRVVVVAGPSNDILPGEREALARYLDSGGRALVLLESRTEIPELTALMARYGVVVNHDFVIDTQRNGQAFGGGIEVPLVDEYNAHPITDGFREMSLYDMPRSLGAAEDAPEGLDVRVLAASSRSSWGETNYHPNRGATWDEREDLRGPRPLVVAVGAAIAETPRAFRQRIRAGEPAPVGDPLLVVAGDVDFASNALFAFQGDGDLFLNSVNWLAGQQELISIRPKKIANKRVLFTDGRKGLTFLLLVVLVPALPTVTGMVVMVKRKK